MSNRERLFKYLKPMRKLLIVAMVFALLFVVAQISQPFLLGKALDASKVSNYQHYYIYTFVALGLAIGGTIFAYIFEVVVMNVSQRVIKNARNDIYEKINAISIKDFDKKARGDLVLLEIRDMENLAAGLFAVFKTLIQGVFTIIVTIIMMVMVNWILAIGVVVLSPLSMLMAKIVSGFSHKHYKKQSQLQANISSITLETLNNIELSALERFAPLPLQESWDNAGLQVGLTETEVSGALLCLDVNEAILDEAIAKGCNLVVSHHPLLFRGLKTISDLTDVQRTVRKAIQNNIAVISMHTNMDNAQGGVNFKIAEKLGLKDVRFLVENGPSTGSGTAGSGTVAELVETLPAEAFIQKVKATFSVDCAMCNALLQRPIQKVAICGGAGDFLLDEAVKQGADAFITGEMHYHQYFGYDQQIQICVIGHYQSEQFTSEIFREIIAKDCPDVPTYIAETITNPILYV